MVIATVPTAPEIVLFLGRFHLLLVHLPIGFLILLGVFEILARQPHLKVLEHGRNIILGLAVGGSALTAGLGLLLSQAGGYDPALLQYHKLTGLAVVAGSLLAWAANWRSLKRTYYGLLSATLLTMILTGHYGGSMTHGRGYLTRYAPEPVREFLGETTATPAVVTNSNAPDQMVVYTQFVHPILQSKCSNCHNETKLKGNFRVDSVEALLKGGESGPAIVCGNAADSRLIKQTQLPDSDEKHMPPPGKPQLTADEVTLLSWWINAGANPTQMVSDLTPPQEVRRILENLATPQSAKR